MSETMSSMQPEVPEKVTTGIAQLRTKLEASYARVPYEPMLVHMQHEKDTDIWEDSTVYGPVYGSDGPSKNQFSKLMTQERKSYAVAL